MRKCAFPLLLLLAGCTTTSQMAYVQDGVEYGVTEGPFRGRWWNYYERGRSFLDGGFFAEARRDFEQALKERNRDQRWARTYGLHFSPQYFPNREYGVVLYHEEDYQGAVAALERSNGQQPSARSAYYLRLARKALSTQDKTAPVLSVAPVGEGNETSRRTIALSIRATDDSFVASVTVDGRALLVGAPAPQMTLDASVPVHPGKNEILIQAVDVAGNPVEARLAFYGDFDGPAVSFDVPIALPGVVEGVVSDRTGLRSLSIGGVEAALSPVSEGLIRFRAVLTREEMRPPLTFSAHDELGNTSQGIVPGSPLQKTAAATGHRHVPGSFPVSYQSGQRVALARSSAE